MLWKCLAILIVAIPCSASAEPFVYQFTGTWGNTNAFWTGAADYTITITADNGGTDPFNEVYDISQIVRLLVISGDVNHVSLPFTNLGFGGATLSTTAAGELQTFAPGSFGQWATNGGSVPYLLLGDPNQGAPAFQMSEDPNGTGAATIHSQQTSAPGVPAPVTVPIAPAALVLTAVCMLAVAVARGVPRRAASGVGA